VEFDDFYNIKVFRYKTNCQSWPCWCSINYSIISNCNPLESYEIGKRISILAENAGFEKGTVTGHSMRKGTATSWILNLVLLNGTYSTNDWHDVEDHVGWSLNSGNTKKYIDQNIKLIRDTTNLITNERPDAKSFSNSGLLNNLNFIN